MNSYVFIHLKLRGARLLLFVGVMMLLIASAAAQTKPAAELIITNAKIWTVDSAHPRAQAVAVIGERIVAVGTNEEIDAWRGSGTRVIDASGRLLLPGFNDAHTHFLSGGFELDGVHLKDAKTKQEFIDRIAKRAKEHPGEWITGGEWDDQGLTPAELPKREWIDAVTPDTPVFITRYDGHMSLANSLVLKRAGVTKATTAPAGGEIVRDATGEPTGVLKDAAQSFVYKIMPASTRDMIRRAAKRALEHAASLGVTSVQEMGVSRTTMNVYAELAEKGELTTRIYVVPSIMRWEDQQRMGLRHGFGSSMLRTGGLKGFADGSLGSTTAYFFEPYLDAPNTRGLLSDEMQPPAEMQKRMVGGDAIGLQLCIHAIGDAAISTVLDMFGAVVKVNGEKDRRLRIEHAQHVAPKDFARFARLGVIASMQPYHAIDDGRWAEKRIGPERIKTTYAFKTMLDNGVRLAFGSDWTVAPLNPLEGIYAAVTRRTLDGKNPDGWVPEQKITVQQAIEGYTMGSAYAEYQEKEKGSITTGKLADLVLLSDDILTIAPAEIRNVKVVMTVMGGKVVFGR